MLDYPYLCKDEWSPKRNYWKLFRKWASKRPMTVKSGLLLAQMHRFRHNLYHINWKLEFWNNKNFQASGDYNDGDMCENEDDDELYDECLYQRYISDRTLDGVYESSRVKFFSTTGDLVIFTMSLVFCTIAIILFILLLKL